MRKILFPFLIFSFAYFLVSPIGAETDTAVDLQNENTNAAQVSETPSSLPVTTTNRLDEPAAAGESAQERFSELHQARSEKIEERKAEAQAKRQEALEQFKAKREELKERLQEMRDQRKAQIVARINDRLAMINRNRTDHFTRILDRLEQILDKLQARAEEAQAKGKDTSSLQAAIDNARIKITSAHGVVEAQASKDYTLQITDEDNLKEIIQAAISSLKTDLAAAREVVKETRQSVQEVFRTLKSLASGPGVEEGSDTE